MVTTTQTATRLRTPKGDFHIVSGGVVFPVDTEQRHSDRADLVAEAEDARGDLLGVLRAAAGKIRAGSRYKAPKTRTRTAKSVRRSVVAIQATPRNIRPENRAGHLQHHGFILGPNKSDVRIDEKLEGEKDGDPAQITDYLRGTLIVEDPAELDRAENFFRPANNSNVVAYENSIARPDEARGLRRLKILYRMPNGHIAEIQIYHKDAIPHLDASHIAYRRYRQAKCILDETTDDLSRILSQQSENSEIVQRALKKAQDTFDLLSTQIAKFSAERARHNQMAIDVSSALDSFRTQERFYVIDGVPVVHITRPDTADAETLIAQRDSDGVIRWHIDNSYETQLKGQTPVSRRVFYGAAAQLPQHSFKAV